MTVAAGVTTDVLRSEAACRSAGDPGDAQCADGRRRRRERAGPRPVRHRRTTQGGVGDLRRGRRRADRPGIADGRRDGACRDRVRRTSSWWSRRWWTRASRRACPGRWPPIWSSQTMAGSAAMLLERLDAAQPAGDAAMGTAMDTTAAQLRATVTSPGGTTAAGLRELEKGGLRAAAGRRRWTPQKQRSSQLGITSG